MTTVISFILRFLYNLTEALRSSAYGNALLVCALVYPVLRIHTSLCSNRTSSRLWASYWCYVGISALFFVVTYRAIGDWFTGQVHAFLRIAMQFSNDAWNVVLGIFVAYADSSFQLESLSDATALQALVDFRANGPVEFRTNFIRLLFSFVFGKVSVNPKYENIFGGLFGQLARSYPAFFAGISWGSVYSVLTAAGGTTKTLRALIGGMSASLVGLLVYFVNPLLKLSRGVIHVPALSILLTRLGSIITAVQKVDKAKANIHQLDAREIARLVSGDKGNDDPKPKGKKALLFAFSFRLWG